MKWKLLGSSCILLEEYSCILTYTSLSISAFRKSTFTGANTSIAVWICHRTIFVSITKGPQQSKHGKSHRSRVQYAIWEAACDLPIDNEILWLKMPCRLSRMIAVGFSWQRSCWTAKRRIRNSVRLVAYVVKTWRKACRVVQRRVQCEESAMDR